MAKYTTVERIAILETKFDLLKDTVEVGFHDLGEKIDAASMNGQTTRAKNMSAKLGDPEDVAILSAVVEAHKRRMWIFSPLKSVNDRIVSAVLWFATAAALIPVHGWIHTLLPFIP